MPLVYACIVPPEADPGAERTAAALEQVAAELALQRPEVALLIVRPEGILPGAIGCGPDGGLTRRILDEAAKSDVPAVALRRPDVAPLPSPVREALGAAAPLVLTTSSLSARHHFDFGRAAGYALAAEERRVALVCTARLSQALTPDAPRRYDPAGRSFDERYRRAIDEWNVKWLVQLDAGVRQHAAEEAVLQTALLMGALSGYRIQPRVLSYEAPGGAGCLVAAIDVLGPRRGR